MKSTSRTYRIAIEQALARLARAQERRPLLFTLVPLLLAILSAILASRLELRSRFDQLLPDNQPSVQELERLTRLTHSNAHIFILLEGASEARLRQMSDELVGRLRRLGRPWVADAQNGVQASRRFLMPRAGLFLSLDELRKLDRDMGELWEHEAAKRADLLLDEEEEARGTPRVTVAGLLGRLKRSQHAAEADRYKDGYFQSADGRALVVLVRSAHEKGNVEGGQRTLREVQRVVAELHRRPEYRTLEVGYAGDLVTEIAEYGVIRADLTRVGLLGCGLVLGVVLLFFMRLRALFTMGLTIATGVAWTFGLTQLAIGHLNIATGFLFSIIVGNGINFGIIYMARYFEGRRAGLDPRQALECAHRTTWLPTLAAALAASAAYGSLSITDFRAFKHFALIGSTGMLLCWIATFAVTPPLLVWVDRLRPFHAVSGASWLARLRRRGLRYDTPFATLIRRAPESVAFLGLALGLAGVFALVRYVGSEPIEYDMRRLKSDMGESTEMYRVSARSQELLGSKIDVSSMLVVCDRPDQALGLKRALEARRAAAPRGLEPFEAVHTLFDFVPEAQQEKLPLLSRLRRRLLKAHDRGYLSAAEWKDIEPLVPPANLEAFGPADLPAELARPYSDRRGLRGTVALIQPTAGVSGDDLRYLVRWADSLRETRLASGEVIRASGQAVIFADMLKAVTADIPWAVGASLVMTFVAVVLWFRGRALLWVFFSLGIGVGMMALYLFLTGARIHFINFIALPITFGIGADYAVNFLHRYFNQREELPQRVLNALEATGGAVILCSLTTILGYLALLSSVNQGIRGLGALAVMGEVACLVAALLVVPALLYRRDSRAARARLATAPASTPERAPRGAQEGGVTR